MSHHKTCRECRVLQSKRSTASLLSRFRKTFKKQMQKPLTRTEAAHPALVKGF